jgi:hypothetical protein
MGETIRFAIRISTQLLIRTTIYYATQDREVFESNLEFPLHYLTAMITGVLKAC